MTESRQAGFYSFSPADLKGLHRITTQLLVPPPTVEDLSLMAVCWGEEGELLTMVTVWPGNNGSSSSKLLMMRPTNTALV